VIIRGSSRATVTLVALCFTTVLGISLAGYIAVCSRTMQLSNRTFQAGLSRQLAELGLEEGLRAFNKRLLSGTDTTAALADWSTGGVTTDWTLDTTNKRATATITFPSTKFGQGVTGSVKIRIDNYNADQTDSAWYSSTNYRVNDYVGYNGSWYRCVRAHSNQTPAGIANMAYWVPDPMPAPLWSSTATYKAEDVVYYTSTNTWYRCILAPTANQAPSNTTYWTSIWRITLDSGYFGINKEILYYYGIWYYYDSGVWPYWFSTPSPPNSYAPVVSWCWRQGYAYAFNDLVFYGDPGVWYRCKTAHTSTGAILPTNTAYWENAQTGSMWGWSSSLNYNLGDVVYSGSSWYRCIMANSNKAPASYPAYWSAYPLLTRDWNSSKQYSQNDTVRYNGVWYRSLQNSNIGQNPVTATTWWIGANTGTASYQWNATTAYSAGNYMCYGGVWYKCISATTANAGHSPNNTTYWTPTWTQASGVTTGAPVIYAEGTVNVAGNPSNVTQLRATIAPAPLFPNAAAANASTLTANSGGTVDSYDSKTGTYASQINSTTNYSAVLASGYTAGTAITLSSTDVKGYLAAPSSSSSPYAPLYSSGGTVKGYTSPVSPNIDLTRISRSPYIPKFDTIPGGAGGLATNWATTPKGTALELSSTVNLGTPGAITPSRYYYNANLTIGGASIQYLKINGPVILHVNGDLFITNSSSIGRIDIASTGSAEIHVTGAFKADAGGEGILNYTSDPKSLIIISDTAGNATQFYSEGVNPLYGNIYMPYSTSTTGYYNDNNNTNVYGAISANKITYSGANLNIHYDTSLRYATFGGVDQPYAITEWRELTDAAELATMP
jgi:hypothetical protein